MYEAKDTDGITIKESGKRLDALFREGNDNYHVTQNSKSNSTTNKLSVAEWLAIIFLGAPGGIVLLYGFYAFIKVIVETAAADRKKRQAEKAKFEAEKKIFSAAYEGKSPEVLSGMPKDEYLDRANLPCSKGDGQWGTKYTRYISRNGTKYHMLGCKYAHIPVHAITVKRRGLEPCKTCKSYLPDMKWYEDYLVIKSKKEKYDIK